MTSRAIWWVRRDLRLDDNSALLHAARAEALLPVYVHAQAEEGSWPFGGAQRWWLARSLAALDRSLREAGSRLLILDGDAAETLLACARAVGATAVVWSRRFEPTALAQEERVRQALVGAGIGATGMNTNRLFDPRDVATQAGRPYQVFTPFARACLERPPPEPPQPAPSSLPRPPHAPAGLDIADLDLEPKADWAGEMAATWVPGEAAGRARLQHFIGARLADYPRGRDVPATDGSSLLSPHLAFGEVGIRRVWHAVASSDAPPASVDKLRAELLWREFATHVLFHFPHTDLQPLRPGHAAFPWRSDAQALRAWQRGRTGYPLVDAGMRQLWRTGWMHNRARMVTASFLVKHLMLPWQDGARWFWDTLVDADLASNSLGWQWAAGCGADAAPYFRIFNPTAQAEKFDPRAQYVQRWVPELAAPGAAYPPPIVAHAFARERALAALASVSGKAPGPALPPRF